MTLPTAIEPVKKYYRLTKPGIVRGNAITASAGFFLASRGDIDWLLYLAMLSGLSFVVAAACVFNNYLDRDIDAKMKRTAGRALVSGDISTRSALLFASILQVAGIFILGLFTTVSAVAAALVGLFFYVIVYGFAKRKTVWGTVIGSISGAVPPVVGYTAVSADVDTTALMLFLILVLWQMPHFYAISIFRRKDYKAAGIPVLSIKKGVSTAKVRIILYIYGFTAAAAGLHLIGRAGDIYLAVSLILGLAWLWLGIKNFKSGDDELWSKKMFGFSLLVISFWSLAVAMDHWLP